MSTEADEWVQLLAHHPIFTAPLLDSTSVPSSEARGNVRRERIALRGTDMFVAVGNEIRWINLRACKDAFARSEGERLGGLQTQNTQDAISPKEAVCSVEWTRLGCKDLMFDITRLVINGSGKLIAAVGTHDVAVVEIPNRGAIAGRGKGKGKGAFEAARSDDGPHNAQWTDCQAYFIGTAYPKARVVDVIWHAMSTSDSHLVVLYSSGMLRMFDVSATVENAEQTMSIFGSGYVAAQAVSLSMGGASALGWSRATAYVATTDGSIYALCPLLPRSCLVERKWLASLHETAVLDMREWQAEEYVADGITYSPPELIAARDAESWLSGMIKLAEETDEELMCLTLPPRLTRPLGPQGPFLMQPDPTPVGQNADDLGSAIDDSCDDVSAILRLETKCGLGIIAVAYCDAHVEVFADLEPVIGCWSGAREIARERQPPVLATLGTVDLDLKPNVDGAGSRNASDNRPSGAVALVGDPLNSCVFYALHSNGVHRVDMRTFGMLLDAAIGQEDAKAKAAFEGLSAAKPAVQCIVNTSFYGGDQHPTPAVGLAVIHDVYLSYSLLALVDPSQLTGASLSLIQEPDAEADAESQVALEQAIADSMGTPRRINRSYSAKDVAYVPRLPGSKYATPKNASNLPPRIVVPDSDRNDGMNGDISEDKLRILGELVAELRAQMSAVSQAHASMRNHLNLQVQEHWRQHSKLGEISAGFQRHFEQMRRSQRRIDNLRDNASRQAMRVDGMLRQLIAHYHPNLTPTEQKYAKEVKEIDIAVNGSSGFVSSIQKLRERLDKVLYPAKDSSGKTQVEARLESMMHKLDCESETMNETCERVAELRVRLEDVDV
ncbi:hypothetical protein GGI15_000218 [Coemansia interrupta]|uniref:Uncharacterized protein n=1 Tax=Coemansia interrupta TaxID=1126814 RepID=A0A9W8LPR1_9FUNG|nr:hypothetical protein GGI15_000218 [Coemansia interrupta]